MASVKSTLTKSCKKVYKRGLRRILPKGRFGKTIRPSFEF